MYPLLNQALRHEEETQTANRNCQLQGAHERNVVVVVVVVVRTKCNRSVFVDTTARMHRAQKSLPHIPAGSKQTPQACRRRSEHREIIVTRKNRQ